MEGSLAFHVNGKPVYLASNVCELVEGLEWWSNTQGGLSSFAMVIGGIRIGIAVSAHEIIQGSTMCTFIADPKTAKITVTSRERMVQAAIAQKSKIGVLVGRKHPSLVTKNIILPEGEDWAVLGVYVMTDAWKEKREDGEYLMARLQMVNTDYMWWESLPLPTLSAPPQDHGMCPSCQQPLRKSYEDVQPFCCRLTCPSAVQPVVLPDTPMSFEAEYLGAEEDLSSITLDDFEFLPPNPRSFTIEELENRLIPRTARPNQPSSRKNYDGRSSLNETQRKQLMEQKIGHKAFVRGYVCRICYRFNQRLDWSHLKCRECGNVLPLKLPDAGFDRLIGSKWLNQVSTDALIDAWYFAPGIVDRPTPIDLTGTRYHGQYIGIQFELEGDNVVQLAVPTKASIDGPYGNKAMFNELWKITQSGELPLRRELVKATQTRVRGTRTNHFGKNYGEAYDTNMETNTTPVQQQPREIREIMDAVESFSSEISDIDCHCNEYYVVGYGPNNKMSFHQDGENDIKGDAIIATSYGGEATMSFAYSDPHITGRKSSKGTSTGYPRLVKATNQLKEKRALIRRRDDGKLTDIEFWKAYSTLLGDEKNKPPTKPVSILQFPIPGNGAIVIQAGKSLNTIYQHQAESNGVARIVITGRILFTEEEKAARKVQAAAKEEQSAKVDHFDGGWPDVGPESEPEDQVQVPRSQVASKRKATKNSSKAAKRRKPFEDEDEENPSATVA